MPATHSEHVRNQTDITEDEIELIDLLRVIWKWKYLILCGTVFCAVASLAVSSILPKIFRAEMLIRPGILSYNNNGKNVYIDTPVNIKGNIESGAFDFRILSNLKKSNRSDVPKALMFNVKLRKSSDSVQIRYETPEIEQGIEILDLLGKLLIEEYRSHVKFAQNEVDKNINIARAEIQKNRSIKRSNEINIINIKKRVQELETGIVFVNENTAYLKKERNALLSKEKDKNDIFSTILYLNAIQQNLQLANDYENEITSLKRGKETELQKISSLENDIQVQIAKIDNLELKKDIIQNIRVIQKAYSSPHPIKPKKKLIVVLATMVGLFMMLFLSFFFEYISKNKEQKLSA